MKIWKWTWSSQSNEQPEQLQKEPGKSLDFISFFFNRLQCGTKFLRLGQIGFSRWELIFGIFRKYPVPSIDNIIFRFC